MSMSVTLVDTGSVERANVRTVPGQLVLTEPATVKAGTLLERSGDDFALYSQGTPTAVLLYDLAAGGRLPIDAMVSGEVNRTRLIVHGEGAPSEQAIDQLRAAGILAVAVQQLGRPDTGAEGGL